MLVRNVAYEFADKLLSGEGMEGEPLCLVVNKVESYRCPVIANNPALRDCRPFGIAADVADSEDCI